MRLIRPSLVLAVVTLVSAAACTLITDVDRTQIPEKGSSGSGGSGATGGSGGTGGGGGTGGSQAGAGGEAGSN